MLDPRLFDLLETLAAADLDWLVNEVIQGILAGKVPLESVEEVKIARSDVARRSQDKRAFARSDDAAVIAPGLQGPAQFEWAVAHISQRLSDALAMMSIAAERLDQLVDGSDVDVAHKTARAPRVRLVLAAGDEIAGEAVTADIGAARQGLSDLVQALEQWRDQATGFDA